MKFIAAAALIMSTFAFANEDGLKITAFYKLNQENTSRDTAADVCFSLTPAPTTPQFAQVTVDKGYNTQGTYSAWIGPKGSACVVVSTFRGRVEVEVPELDATTSKSL